ncbi:5-formyltetrahydrofolate cyclo-ligase [Wenyingzhuangia sp. 2_MG-2023]|uniref:5-formyltetrahydrofolate cyclo-ligase n=1 Tax=Wenyingzhuangia sp. 2_MG-2023 TaxID=3062639 RepID=UPI0026E275EF|nr:5-formyltetrahydrofolate cyclo-ligase [Wenyingzhuangia sp. 2_MG-2023]MDO6736995.1 5-formyltetrahydrofolate cyclo-ligase [Wenyingzhuangia sp. 2_MG-2023]
MNKNKLRKKYSQLRDDFSLEVVENKSIQIANQLLKLNIWDQTYYHLFLSIQDKKEVDTEQILHILFAKNKEVVVSKSNFKTNELSHFLLTDNTKLAVNSYGIPEPTNGLSVPEDMIDVVFIPLLAFDDQGNRVGYGKGFYDGFLSKCKPETLKVGLSFFEAEENIEDVISRDVALDYCVTPNKIYEFKSK